MKWTLLAAAGLAAGLAFAPGEVRANCGWNIEMLKKEVALIEAALPLAETAGKETAARVESALARARSGLQRAETLNIQGASDACEIVLEEARNAATAARAAFPEPKKTG